MNKNVISFILIIVAIGVFFTFTDPRITQIQSTAATNGSYLSSINNSVQLISERDAILKQYNAISASDLARLNTMLPDSVDNVRLIIDINGIASHHGFSLQGITTSADSSSASSGSTDTTKGLSEGSNVGSGGSYGTVTISFNFNSSYQNFLAFMQDIQSSLRILDVKQLTITAGTIPGTYNYSMQLSTYWLK